MHLQGYCVLMVQYIYISAQERDDAGTAGVLMGGGNNYSSGLFQLLPRVISVSDYGHSCTRLVILPLVNVLLFCDIGIDFSGRKNTSVLEF